MLRSNNGGKYTSKDLNNVFYRVVGIKRDFIVPYNPQ